MNTNRKGNSGPVRRIAAAMIAGGVLLTGALGFAAQRNTNSVASVNPAPAATTQQITPTTAARAASTVPKPLESVGHYGENAYDKAKLGDWSKANRELASLKSATARLQRAAVGNTTALKADVATLDRAISSRDRAAALAASNKVTLDAANLSASYRTPVPVGVTKLDYYGRQLEIQAAARNTAGLKQTASNIQRTWSQVRPQIVSNGGTKEAKRFDTVVAQVRTAHTSSQYNKVSATVLSQVDFLEKVFA